jgi:hypothetical protein
VATQTLNPNTSSSAASAWTITGGAASVEAALSVASDAGDTSYVKRAAATYSASTAWLVLGTSNYTIPAGSKVTKVRVAVKVLVPSNGAFAFCLGDADTWSFRPETVTGPTGSAVWVYGPWEAAPANGGTWTQARLDAATLAVKDYAWDSASYVSTFREARLEVQVSAPPTVSVTAPTGTVSTSTPTVAWTYTQADGDVQDAYQVRVFDSTTYGAGGFDPATSTALWETLGYGSGTSVITDVLPEYPTQRAYVRVYSRAGLWSTWAYSTFTYAVETPAAPQLTAYWVEAEQTVALVGTSSLNLLSAEASTFATTAGGWVDDTTGTAPIAASPSYDSGVGYHGSTSMFFTTSGAGTRRAKRTSVRAVQEGMALSVTARLYSWSGSRSARVGIRWIGPGTLTWGSTVSVGAAWTQVTLANAVAPTGATSFDVVVEFTATGADTLSVDAVAAHVGTAAVWSVGGYDPASETYTLERLRNGATTWETVATGTFGSTTRDLYVTDPTAGRVNTDTYRVRSTATRSSIPADGAWSSTVTYTPTGVTGYWLKSETAAYGPLRVLRTFEDRRSREQGVFVPLPDASGVSLPLVVEGGLSGTEGTLEILALNSTEQAEVNAALALRERVLLQDPYGVQRWVRITDHTRESEGPTLATQRTLNRVSWVEVA